MRKRAGGEHGGRSQQLHSAAAHRPTAWAVSSPRLPRQATHHAPARRLLHDREQQPPPDARRLCQQPTSWPPLDPPHPQTTSSGIWTRSSATMRPSAGQPGRPRRGRAAVPQRRRSPAASGTSCWRLERSLWSFWVSTSLKWATAVGVAVAAVSVIYTVRQRWMEGQAR